MICSQNCKFIVIDLLLFPEIINNNEGLQTFDKMNTKKVKNISKIYLKVRVTNVEVLPRPLII